MQYKASNLYIIKNDNYPIFPFSHLKLSNQLTVNTKQNIYAGAYYTWWHMSPGTKGGGAQGITPWGQVCYQLAPL